MAYDEDLLAAATGEGSAVLRLYTWNPPAVSLGRFQSTEGINLSYLQKRGWDLVRRPTGGRAVLHQYELTYGLVLPPSLVEGVGIRTSYTVLTGALNAGLATLLGSRPEAPPPACDARDNRSPNCFALSGECDSLVATGKLVGSAQVRRSGALLQHGSILLHAEREAWTHLFGSAGRLVTLDDLLGAIPSLASVEAAVIQGFAGAGFVPLV